MKIELRDINYYSQIGENDTFAAQLYINGHRAALVVNNNESLQTRYMAYNIRDEHLIGKAEAYCKKLRSDAGKPLELWQFIDKLYLKHLREKELEKAMELGIVFGDPDGSYLVQGFKVPFEMLLVHPMATEVIGEVIRQRIAPELSDGKIILNTNIPEGILQRAGLHTNQYTKPLLPLKSQVKQKISKRPGKRL